jgi:hypothetical protein
VDPDQQVTVILTSLRYGQQAFAIGQQAPDTGQQAI